jgi:hypothetical protein
MSVKREVRDRLELKVEALYFHRFLSTLHQDYCVFFNLFEIFPDKIYFPSIYKISPRTVHATIKHFKLARHLKHQNFDLLVDLGLVIWTYRGIDNFVSLALAIAKDWS